MNNFKNKILPLLMLMNIFAFQNTSLAEEATLDQVINLSMVNNQQESDLQSRIEKLDDETRIMFDEYQRISREVDSLILYNQQLNRMIESQKAEQDSIKSQKLALQKTQQEVAPMMIRMVQWMKSLLNVDQPFLTKERNTRVQKLEAMLDRSDISLGEKYRRILEAYQIEIEYGRTIEAYRTELNFTGPFGLEKKLKSSSTAAPLSKLNNL